MSNLHPEVMELEPSSSPEGVDKKLRTFQQLRGTLVLLLLGAGLGMGGSYLAWSPQSPLAALGLPGSGSNLAIASPPSTSPTAIAPHTSAALTAANPNFITSVVQQVGPAVVRIDATRTVESSPVPDLFNDPFFQHFFGNAMPQPSEQIQHGIGSGFITDSHGQIITNAHVIDGADTVKVTLKDGRSFEGKVMGSDPVTDIAVVKVEAENLPTVSLADSDQLQPGEWAIAIGNPLGLDNTVTVGIISQTGRSSGQVGSPNQRVQFIQTDAAINPGNSGGPLLNQAGEVIGMNTAIIQDAQSVGFAIPSNTIQHIAQQLVTQGKVVHPYLGIQMVTLTPELRAEINNDPNSGLSVNEDQGILIVRVVPNSPAAEAGLRAGDVIHKVDGETVDEAEKLQQRVEDSRVGGTIRIEVQRQGIPQTIEVHPGKLADDTEQNPPE
ncbi:MAG: HhoA/HhoB/HtrA family serine endopeptidase [Prochlorotrichaceae cyanobacterium]|jgi:S1-C subfamily serine protease